MVYQVGRLEFKTGVCEYSVCIKEPLRWRMFSSEVPPKVFVVLESISVPTEDQGQGIGSYLLEQVVKLARQVSAEHICLWTDVSESTQGLEWFKNKGFCRSGQVVGGCMQPMIAVVAGEPEVTTVENQVLPNNQKVGEDKPEMVCSPEYRLVHKKVHTTGLIKRPGVLVDNKRGDQNA